MTRLVMLMVAVVAFGCATKPSEDECRKAIANMQTLMGTEHLGDDEMVESQVRRCKGGSTKKSVDCAIKAQSLDDLRKCDFYKVPENAKGIGPSPSAGSAGSAAGSAGSAAGSAAGSGDAGSAGSAAAGSGDAGSAGSAAAGSAAAGSAAAGSAAAGSAAAGSAAAGSAAAGSAAAGSAAAGSAAAGSAK